MDDPSGSGNLKKGNPPLIDQIGRLWPIFFVFTLWGLLIVWFVIVQLLDRD